MSEVKESKKTTKAMPTAAAEGRKKAAEERKVRESNETWERVEESKLTKEQKEVKLAPQATAIVETLANGSMKRTALIAKLEETGVLKTRQPVGRIIAYYKKLLTEESGRVAVK